MPNVINGTGASEFLGGSPFPDSISGFGGDDTLMGHEGDDTLDGGHGNDSVDGGEGDDLLLSSDGTDFYEGQDGTDTLSYAPSPSAVFVTKPQDAALPGSASDGFGDTDVIGHGTADLLVGSSFNDTLFGSPIYTANWGEVFGDDDIDGGDGNDSIYGQSGDDEIAGGPGNDHIDGGAGLDFAYYWEATSGITVNLQTGLVSGGDGNDVLTGIEGVGGSQFDDNLTGDAGNNIFGGLEGNDTLSGAGGTDTVVFLGALGPVSVNLALGVASGEGNDVLSGFEVVWGSEFADSIVGSAGADELVGNLGDDTLRGGGGNDTLNGGTTGDSADGAWLEDEVIEDDVAVFTGNRSEYTLSYHSSTGQLIVTDNVVGRDGTDTLFSIEVLQFADQTVQEDLATGRLDPWATYLATSVNDGPTFPQDVWLEDIGLAPGDIITITSLGAYSAGPGFSDTSTGVLAVFYDLFEDAYLAPASATQFVSRPQAITNVATDIPQDFFIPAGGTTLVRIPAGATMLQFSPNDSFFSDNVDENEDYRIVVRRLDAATTFPGNDQLFGTSGADTLLGGTGRDTLVGGAGNDLLDGGTITDRANYTDLNALSYASSPGAVNINLSGMSGDGSVGQGTALDGFGGTDTVRNVNFITGSAFGDVILGSSAVIFEEFTPGAGNDTVDGGAIDAVLQNNTNRVNYSASSGAMTVNLGAGTASGGDQGTDTLANIVHVRGSAFGDTLTGSTITLTEQFEGMAGNDTIDGLAGIDIVRYDSAGIGVNVNLATGIATDGLGGTDTLLNIEGVRGSFFADTLTGGNPANGTGTTDGFESFIGQGGNDTIDGGGGYDRIDYTTSTSGVVVDMAAGTAQDGLGGTDTFSNIEAVRGSPYNDTLHGSTGASFESFEGREGNDTVDGKGGTDRIDYQFNDRAVTIDLALGTAIDFQGNTTIPVARYTDTFLNIENVRGSSFGDVLRGDGSANWFESLDGADSVEGQGGNDTLFGDAGHDTLLGGTGRDTLVGGSGDDLLDGGAITDRANYTDLNVLSYSSSTAAVNINLSGMRGDGSLGRGTVLDGFGGTDSVANVNFITASAFNDVILGSNAAIFEEFTPGAGNDTVDGGTVDAVLQNNANRVNYSASTGAMTVNLGAGTASGGNQGTDTLINIIHVRGSGFNDTLTGSNANVTEQFEGAAGNDTIDGIGGIDIVRYDSATTGITVNLATGIALDGLGGTDTLLNIEGVRASNFADTLIGGNPANGTGTTDGFETFLGQGGNDTIDGGGGYDRIDYTTSTSAVVVDMAAGTALDGLGGTDTFTNIEAVRGSPYHDTLDGSTGASFESFEGREGNDTIDGKGGTDRIDYQFNDRAVTVNLAAGTAIDFQSNTTIPTARYTDTFLNIENVRGSSFGDLLLGDAADNRFDPLNGDDTVEGLAGNDYFAGSFGVDTLTYANSPSAVTVTVAQDSMSTGMANDGFGGTDTIERGASNIVIGSPFNDVLTGSNLYFIDFQFGPDNLHGGAGNDSITGNGGEDKLYGDAGNDSLSGGGEDDELHGGAGDDTVDGGSGIDTASFEDASAAVNVSLLAGTATGGSGNDLVLNIEKVIGSDFNDTLTGGAGNDTLTGGAGNDVINGGAGVDFVDYMSAASGVTVNLATGSATGAADSDTLSNIEGIVGSEFSDVLTGGAGNDTIDGRGGDDTIDGGLGTDVAVFSGDFSAYAISTTSTPGELVVAGPDGRDRLRNIEVLQFADRSLTMIFGTDQADDLVVEAAAGPVVVDGGAGDDRLVANNSGNALLGGLGSDQLLGGDGNDNLDGGTGSDTMTGGAGDDVYVVDSENDAVVEGAAAMSALLVPGSPLTVNLGGGIDKVVASINYTLGNFVENLTLAADAGHLAGTGNALNNIMTGNAGNNTLDGAAGNDTLNGGDGNDSLVGGAGNDTIDGGSGRDFAVFTGAMSAHTLTFGANGITIAGPDGTDLLTNVERITFGDGFRLAFDIEGNGGQAYRLYQAAFDRTPDIGGLGFQINVLDIGFQLVDISANFIESPEFLATYGSLDNTQFVTQLYRNVLDRDPDQGGLDFHKGNLDAGLPRNYLLAQFSESPENQANVIGAIVNGMTYTL